MSLAIDIDRVTAVLLADDWHQVKDASFTMDAYEYIKLGNAKYIGDATSYLLGGQEELVPATGFAFKDEFGSQIYGPITSILAVRCEGV